MNPIDQFSKVTFDEGVLRIVIATTENGASLDFDGVAQGTEALRMVGDDLGSVLLVGDGDNFCSGGNVHAFASAPDRGVHVAEVAEILHEFVRELSEVTVPVVAGVQGWAAGAGMSLVCLADIAIGGPSTKLRPAYPSIGFTPDGGMSWLLPRVVGISRARDILLSDSVIGGDEAVRIGILSRLVGDDVVQDEAFRLARSLAAGPTDAFRGIKQLLVKSVTNSLSDQLDAETASISAAANSLTGIEGVDAFVEKRRADFGSVERTET